MDRSRVTDRRRPDLPPAVDPWLTAARDVGANAVNGVGMLLHQAAIQLELWTGIDAPIDAMRDSVADVIG